MHLYTLYCTRPFILKMARTTASLMATIALIQAGSSYILDLPILYRTGYVRQYDP